MAERDHNEAENENESRFQRLFLSTMKPGALPRLRLKKLRRWRGKDAPGLCYSRHPEISAARNLMLISDVSVR
jgi:hypothetical protein